MGANRSINIDGKKLRTELKKRNLQFKDVRNKLGYNSDVMSKATRYNRLTPQTMTMLEAFYNISFEDIAPEEKCEEELKEEIKNEPETIQVTSDQLENIIYKATKRCMEELLDKLGDVIYKGTYDANYVVFNEPSKKK